LWASIIKYTNFFLREKKMAKLDSSNSRKVRRPGRRGKPGVVRKSKSNMDEQPKRKSQASASTPKNNFVERANVGNSAATKKNKTTPNPKLERSIKQSTGIDTTRSVLDMAKDIKFTGTTSEFGASNRAAKNVPEQVKRAQRRKEGKQQFSARRKRR
jgi:hypothetical protein